MVVYLTYMNGRVISCHKKFQHALDSIYASWDENDIFLRFNGATIKIYKIYGFTVEIHETTVMASISSYN